MHGESILGESGQFAPRKIVGGQGPQAIMDMPSLTLEELRSFGKRIDQTSDPDERRKLVQELAKYRWPDEGDHFPVLKVVGRTDTRR